MLKLLKEKSYSSSSSSWHQLVNDDSLGANDTKGRLSTHMLSDTATLTGLM